ncbi:DUF2149 domain-containing protein [Nocardioides sp.]|uniref:DUF2149 domain-containing protein n=1 Tax=Nocardioides sp. TaxID=35761 RepID=UPI003513242D
MIRVTPRARRHADANGDPLDGLVNLFDLGIVLSVGFLLAALSSLDLASVLTVDGEGGAPLPPDAVVVPQDAEVGEVPATGEEVVGSGTEVGTVYRLDDGRIVYVIPPEPGPAAPAP